MVTSERKYRQKYPVVGMLAGFIIIVIINLVGLWLYNFRFADWRIAGPFVIVGPVCLAISFFVAKRNPNWASAIYWFGVVVFTLVPIGILYLAYEVLGFILPFYIFLLPLAGFLLVFLPALALFEYVLDWVPHHVYS